MNTLYYFAYGSNLHPLRLKKRAPTARLIGPVELNSYRLGFNKRSIDGSGKCHIYPDPTNSSRVFGALYALDVADKRPMDRVEGLGKGYSQVDLMMHYKGTIFPTFTYIAQPEFIDEELWPYHWYKQLVIVGARYHGFPEQYIAMLQRTPAKLDTDSARTMENSRLLEQMALEV